MNEENIIDVDQNETDTCEEIADTDTISGEDKSENISTNEAAGTTEDIDADYSIDEEPGESSEDTSCSEANEATTVSGATASQVAETGGSKRWSEYTSSAELDDADELMMLDTSAKANKRTLLSKLSDYVLGKLADKVFEKLETQNKTILGALNELNSKAKILQQIKTGIVINVAAGQYKGGSLLVFGRKNPNGVAAFLVSYFRNQSSDNLVAEIVPLDGKTYTAVCDNTKITITGGNLAIHSRMTALSGDGFIHSSVEVL